MLKSILAAFHLTEDDLKQNRVGKLSVSQKARLTQRFVEFLFTAVVIAGGVVLYVTQRSQPTSIEVVVALVFITVSLERAYRCFRLVTDLMHGEIDRVEDRIQLEPISRKAAHMKVGELKFDITTEQLLALRNGLRYTAYFTPYSRMLTAIEPSQITEEDQDAALSSGDLLEQPEKGKRTFRLGEDGELVTDQDPQAAQKSKGV
jgi:hypothetical protein